jgi:uncharacterized protein YqgC (DUF456 family)
MKKGDIVRVENYGIGEIIEANDTYAAVKLESGQIVNVLRSMITIIAVAKTFIDEFKDLIRSIIDLFRWKK